MILSKKENIMNPRLPLYHRIENDLKNKIFSGLYNPGDLLPSERELTETYKVSRLTAREAGRPFACHAAAGRSVCCETQSGAVRPTGVVSSASDGQTRRPFRPTVDRTTPGRDAVLSTRRGGAQSVVCVGAGSGGTWFDTHGSWCQRPGNANERDGRRPPEEKNHDRLWPGYTRVGGAGGGRRDRGRDRACRR